MRSSGRLFRKYLVVIVALVAGVLLTSSVIQGTFAFQSERDGLLNVQRAQATIAAGKIDGFLREIQGQMRAAMPPPTLTEYPLDRREADYQRLRRLVPAITDISFIDTTGRECVRVSIFALNVRECARGDDRKADPAFMGTRDLATTNFSPVRFRGGSEPFLVIGIPEPGTRGVTVADVNLKFILDVVQPIRVGSAGYAYVVDADGVLIAHPDIAQVLRHSDLSDLAQIRAARTYKPGGERAMTAATASGVQVLTAFDRVDPPGWSVFVEQPLDEAFAPLIASILRTVVLLALGLVASAAASYWLARRMTGPIATLQTAAQRIGAGALEERIELRTGDELESLASEFDRMTARLRESYATLERRVDERTRDLATSLEQQRATAEVLKVISTSTSDLQRVLDTIVVSATQLCHADWSAIFQFDGDTFRATAVTGASPELEQRLRMFRVPPGNDSVVGRVNASRRVVHIPDLAADAEYGWETRAGQRDLAPPAGSRPTRSFLGAPILTRGELVGVIVIGREVVQPYSEREIELAGTFGDQAAIAVENTSLFNEIQEKSRQLEAASRNKSEFLANMSHELRTPLNAIIGFSEVLRSEMFGPVNEKQSEYLTDVLTAGQHLLSLINEILDLSKVEAGRMELELSSFSVPDLVGTSVGIIRERAARHGITVRSDIDGVGNVTADERKVKQVLFNLLSNAVKFTPDGGTIEVRGWRVDSEWGISVSDSGVGIPPEDRERIFEEFRQSRTAGSRAHEGTGLGLALAKRFIELHGGRVSVESEVGAGSTFSFTIPEAVR